MANMKIDYVNVYPIIEEHCQNNQVIAEVKVSRTDNNPPHIVYLPYDNSDVYKYISINENNGKVYLTLEGVNAINKDYPDDPSKEITELDFKVVAKDTEVGDSIEIPVKVAVVRVHDEPPVVIDEVKYKLYQDDLKVDYRVLDVRTKFPAYFISKTNYITFKVDDIGRATLTGDGVDYFKNIDTSNGPKTFEFQYQITDKFNNKTIDKAVSLEIVSGSAYVKVPKKSVLAEVGGLLGKDLGEKIEYLKSKLDDKDKRINELYQDLISDNYLLKNFKGPALADLYLNDDYDIKSILEKNISNFHSKISKNEENLLSNIPEQSKNIYRNINYYLNNLTELNDLEANKINYEETLANIIITNLQKYDNVVNSKINSALDLVKDALEESVTTLITKISDLKRDYAYFKRGTYCKDYNAFNNRLNSLESTASDLLEAIDSKSYNEYKNSSSSDALKTYIKNIKNNTAKDILTRLNDDEADIKTNADAIANINKKHLEDWGRSDGWKMITSGTNGSITHMDKVIIYTSNSSDTVRLGNSDTTTTAKLYTSNIKLTIANDTATFSSSGTTKVVADEFDGTATKAKYADLAEYYIADKEYEYGTVLMIGGNAEVTLPEKPVVRQYVPIVGIVSKNPGFIINSEKEKEKNAVLIALKGRTPVKILPSLEIFKGQRLYASLKHPGLATTINEFSEHREDLFLGYALENKKHNQAKNYIEIFVK